MNGNRFSRVSMGLLFSLAPLLASCAPVLRNDGFDFKTTNLFTKSCGELEKLEKEEKKKKGFWTKINPINMVKPTAEEKKEEIQKTVNDCNVPNLGAMTEKFMSIQEANDETGNAGDTIVDVRAKGFSPYMDKNEKVRRQNTKIYHGNAALAAAQMAISPPPLQKTDEIKAYLDLLSQFMAEEYVEKAVKSEKDSFYISTKNTLDIGDDNKFIILYRKGRVIKRTIDGGPVNNPRQEKGFLLGPRDFVIDTIKGGARALVPGL